MGSFITWCYHEAFMPPVKPIDPLEGPKLALA